MTEDQMSRLPKLAQEIILGDRKLEEMRQEPAIPLLAFTEQLATQRRLRAAAEQNWGQRAGNDDSKVRG